MIFRPGMTACAVVVNDTGQAESSTLSSKYNFGVVLQAGSR